MTPFQFLRMVLWVLVAMEMTTALVAGLVPVSPENRVLAGDIVFNCSVAALIALAMLGLLGWVERHG